jgi:hypothetical protein
LIRNEKPIVLFERNCHATEKSEAIACAMRCLVSRVVDPKRIIGKEWRAKEEERHNGLLTHKKFVKCRHFKDPFILHTDPARQPTGVTGVRR